MSEAKKPRDVYDLEVDRLTKVYEEEGLQAFRSAVCTSWGDAEPLFSFCTPTGNSTAPGTECCFGCLTTVHNGAHFAWTPAITQSIRDDERLPNYDDQIEPHHLPIFAEWQRRLDKELGRTPPAC